MEMAKVVDLAEQMKRTEDSDHGITKNTSKRTIQGKLINFFLV
jgi:hypothetical protein